ncbi:MAG: tRNA (adenosine(37)-N6)-dimethylallyltransferase MiaA [Chthonomonadaceae bacterium]|nr:tRNA (adenosine(37)-N6)-dimethylallyltransferase MiaA [Chthonomonadaceae bacterium]
MGPTASGKSDVAESVAERLDARLINADAFQVYKGLNIGTNKPSDPARYDLIDVIDPSEGFGVGNWVSRVLPILQETFLEGRSVVVVGGTGLYIRALFEEYNDMAAAPSADLRVSLQDVPLQDLVDRLLELDPETLVDLSNPVRVRRALERLLTGDTRIKVNLPPFRRFKFGLLADPMVLNSRIERRTEEMWAKGWPEEVSFLLSTGVPSHAPGFRAIGYQSVVRYLLGEPDAEEAKRNICLRTRQYAKRQRAWLRSEPSLVGLSATTESDIATAVEKILAAVKSRGEK